MRKLIFIRRGDAVVKEKLSNNELSQIHKQLMKLLICFRDICEKEGIWYSLSYWTMLGAVRNNGFIPWDADADVYIKINDKERFRSAFKKYGHDGIILHNYNEDRKSLQSHDVLMMEGEDIFENLHLDIYLLVGAPATPVEQRKFANYLFFADAVVRSKYKILRQCKKKNRLPVLVLKVLLFFVPDSVLMNNIINREKRYDIKTSDYTISLATYRKLNDCMPKKIWDNMISCVFEGEEFKIPRKCDYYLKHVYGDDYMTPKKY